MSITDPRYQVLLLSVMQRVVLNWDSAFEFTAEPDYAEDEFVYFYVTVKYLRSRPPAEINFRARVDPDADNGPVIEMEFGEDCWYEVDDNNLWAYMFFDVAQK